MDGQNRNFVHETQLPRRRQVLPTSALVNLILSKNFYDLFLKFHNMTFVRQMQYFTLCFYNIRL
jgi:hypothetical protein